MIMFKNTFTDLIDRSQRKFDGTRAAVGVAGADPDYSSAEASDQSEPPSEVQHPIRTDRRKWVANQNRPAHYNNQSAARKQYSHSKPAMMV